MQWAYDPSRKVVFDLSKRDNLGLPAIVAVSVEPEEGRLIEVAPRMHAWMRRFQERPLTGKDFAVMNAEALNIFAHIDGSKG